MKGFVRQAMAIDSSSPALLCPAQEIMLYWYLFCASINLTLLTVPTQVQRRGREGVPISQYIDQEGSMHLFQNSIALKSLMCLKTRVYGTEFCVDHAYRPHLQLAVCFTARLLMCTLWFIHRYSSQWNVNIHYNGCGVRGVCALQSSSFLCSSSTCELP